MMPGFSSYIAIYIAIATECRKLMGLIPVVARARFD